MIKVYCDVCKGSGQVWIPDDSDELGYFDECGTCEGEGWTPLDMNNHVMEYKEGCFWIDGVMQKV